MLINFLFLFLTVLSLSFSRRSVGICKLTNKCIGEYDSFIYSEKCEYKTECKGKHSQQCNNKYCSAKKEICDRTFHRIDLFGYISNENILKKMFTIDDCPTDYSFQSKDVCINGKNCQVRIIFFKKINTIKIRCQCPKTHTFECGIHFCTIDNKVCNALNQHVNRSIGFSNCLNGQKTFEKRNILPIRF